MVTSGIDWSECPFVESNPQRISGRSVLKVTGFTLEWRKSHLIGALGLHVARRR